MAPFGTLYTLSERIHHRTRKIFGAASINSLELTVPEYVMGVTHKTPEYLTKFPLGKIPSFESSTGLRLIESNAIAFYVAESGPKKDQLLGATPDERATIQQWIFFSELQIEPSLWKVAIWRRGLVPFDAEAEAEGSSTLPRWLDHLERGLQGKRWLLGDSAGPSLADLTVSAVILFGYLTYIDAEMRAKYPETLRWFEQVKAVPELSALYEGEYVDKREEPPVEQ
ncbi:glutathione S-transferase [Thozetella sp. PMI_491]|nr:glutathione S-transferase [Thozetella sp. PMI_491]